jgi:hypothetical protein
MVNVLESTLESTKGEVIVVNIGIESHAPYFSLDSASECLQRRSRDLNTLVREISKHLVQKSSKFPRYTYVYIYIKYLANKMQLLEIQASLRVSSLPSNGGNSVLRVMEVTKIITMVVNSQLTDVGRGEGLC